MSDSRFDECEKLIFFAQAEANELCRAFNSKLQYRSKGDRYSIWSKQQDCLDASKKAKKLIKDCERQVFSPSSQK
jgi:hypothetical protein